MDWKEEPRFLRITAERRLTLPDRAQIPNGLSLAAFLQTPALPHVTWLPGLSGSMS